MKIKSPSFILIIFILIMIPVLGTSAQNTKITGIGNSSSNADVKLECLNCHSIMTPDLVDQWRESKHAMDNVKCNVCHGEKTSEDFIAKPQKERCRSCHPDQVVTHSQSKMRNHACGDCHSVHKFSSKVARDRCIDCHIVQREFYNGSAMEKNNVRCSNCHFFKDYFSISNHSLNVREQSCTICHNNTYIEKAAMIKNETKELLLDAIKDDKQAEISLIENDGSYGLHNPKKARETLATTFATPLKISWKGISKFIVGSNIFGFGILFLIILMLFYVILFYVKRQRDKK